MHIVFVGTIHCCVPTWGIWEYDNTTVQGAGCLHRIFALRLHHTLLSAWRRCGKTNAQSLKYGSMEYFQYIEDFCDLKKFNKVKCMQIATEQKNKSRWGEVFEKFVWRGLKPSPFVRSSAKLAGPFFSCMCRRVSDRNQPRVKQGTKLKTSKQVFHRF